MATASTVTLTEAVKPDCIQPGGGFCMTLELSWGRLRRAWLQRFRPNYVQRMADKRQGECPRCPHNIVDSRDLKFFRNICGFWFRPEDDPFLWRNHLGLARAGLAEIVCFSFLFLALLLFVCTMASLVSPVWWWAAPPISIFWLFILSFFRDPARSIPKDPTALVSPADGLITHIGEVEEPEFPEGRAFRISIFLSIFNVHVNRVPRTSKVVSIRYFPGIFLDARHPDCGVRNEQLWIDMEEETSARLLRVKQISGAIARRIVCWLKPGEIVQAGERFGMIKFGSRTDVLVPIGDSLDLLVKVGDTVRGGTSILLRFQKS